MGKRHFDLIVLGSGPAGSTIATKTAEAGRSVAIIESRDFGGTCALRGCNPKKVYSNAGRLVDEVRRATGKLVGGGDQVQIVWPQLLDFKREFTEPVLRDSEASLRGHGIATIQGEAKFTGPQSLLINGETLNAERIVIATGARPIPLNIPGEELVTHSDEFFELSCMPNRVVFLGGGYISMEFAHVVARCGKQVTIVDRGERVLDEFDPDLVDQLTVYSCNQGIVFRTTARAVWVERTNAGELRVGVEDGDSIDCDLVVHGAGRVPNISSLNPAAGDIESCERGIHVDETMRSVSNPHVYAAGDCAASGAPPLTPSANEEARIVAKNLFADHPEKRPDYGMVPKVAFTTPSIASVGMSEVEACQRRDVAIWSDETSTWGSVRKTGDVVAGYKILVDQSTDHILGAHLLGPAAEETINLFALAMKFGLTATQVKSTLFAFPTFASDVRRMLR